MLAQIPISLLKLEAVNPANSNLLPNTQLSRDSLTKRQLLIQRFVAKEAAQMQLPEDTLSQSLLCRLREKSVY